MKKVISAVLTAAMVVGMGVSVLAATPSKTVADEVKASGSATVTGVLGIVSDVKVTAKEDTAQVEKVLRTSLLMQTCRRLRALRKKRRRL